MSNEYNSDTTADDPREAIDVCPECEVGTLFEVGLDYAGMESNDMVTVYECEYCNHQVRMQPKTT